MQGRSVFAEPAGYQNGNLMLSGQRQLLYFYSENQDLSRFVSISETYRQNFLEHWGLCDSGPKNSNTIFFRCCITFYIFLCDFHLFVFFTSFFVFSFVFLQNTKQIPSVRIYILCICSPMLIYDDSFEEYFTLHNTQQHQQHH